MTESTECQYCSGDICEKHGGRRRCTPSTRRWLTEVSSEEVTEFITVTQMCEKSGQSQNVYIGLTKRDIKRLEKGEVIFIKRDKRGEFSIFIGALDVD